MRVSRGGSRDRLRRCSRSRYSRGTGTIAHGRKRPGSRRSSPTTWTRATRPASRYHRRRRRAGKEAPPPVLRRRYRRSLSARYSMTVRLPASRSTVRAAARRPPAETTSRWRARQKGSLNLNLLKFVVTTRHLPAAGCAIWKIDRKAGGRLPARVRGVCGRGLE